MLTHITTSIFDIPADALVNPVNCIGIMGSGLALQFKQRYPAMFRAYQHACWTKEMRIGHLQFYHGLDNYIINFPTKNHWREKSHLYQIEAGLADFVERYNAYELTSVAWPQLGCGLGGLDWQDVEPLMVRYLEPLPITNYICTL